MELTVAGVVAALGILFGLNYFGLFIAVHVLDRSAKYIACYLAASLSFIVSGLSYFLSGITAYTNLFLVIDDVCVGLGFALMAVGIGRAFGVDVPRRPLKAHLLIGVLLVPATIELGEISVARLSAVSLWQAVVPVLLGIALLRKTCRTWTIGILAGLLFAVGAAIAVRPFVAGIIAANPALTEAAQVVKYGALISVPFLVSLFGIGAVILFHAMSELVKRHRNASITDSLTGLHNRRGFLDAVAVVPVVPSTLIMLDIDRFKQVNDTYGHDVGDRVIVAVAAVLREHVGSPHIAGRLGGEEFAVLLRHAEVQTGHALAQALRCAIEVALDGLVEDGHTITASLGVAAIGVNGIGGALVDADRALYRAKREGRNRVCIADGFGITAPAATDRRRRLRA